MDAFPETSPRLLVVCGDHGIPAFGRKGASTHLREMIAAFRAEGAKVLLAASDPSGDRLAEEDFPVVALPRPRSKKLGMDGRYLLADWLSNSVLREAAMRFQPHAVYERSALYFGAGGRLARSLGCPRMLEVNTYLARELAPRLKFPALAARAEGRIIRGAAAIAAISGVMKERIVRDHGVPAGRIGVYTMAVDPEKFVRRGMGPERRRQAGLPDGVPVLGLVGSMNHYHRPEWFFDLVEALHREDRPVAALVIGGSDRKAAPFRERLAAISPALPYHFTGPVPQADIPGWMEAMDAMAITGAAPQSTPTKLFEAAAMELPVIAPAEEPIRAVFARDDAPGLFDADSFEALAECARRWLDDAEPLRRDAGRLRGRILAEYTWRSHARRVLACFRDWPPSP